MSTVWMVVRLGLTIGGTGWVCTFDANMESLDIIGGFLDMFPCVDKSFF